MSVLQLITVPPVVCLSHHHRQPLVHSAADASLALPRSSWHWQDFFDPRACQRTLRVCSARHSWSFFRFTGFHRKELRSERVKELNASDDRGIAAVREKVKTWSKYEPRGGSVHPVNGRPLPSWKIVVLDEADMMTADAQSALRRVMEEYSRSTRFVIICNYFHKIIDPLVSRCSVYRFQPISAEAQVTRLSEICSAENIKLASDRVLHAIHEVSEGDLRRAVTLLQTASTFYDTLEETTIYDVAGYPPKSISTSLFNSCKESVRKMEETVDRIHSEGWDIGVVTRQLCSLITHSEDTTSVQNARMHLCLAERDYSILMGGSDYLNLLSIGRTFCSILGTAN
eukprot:GHVS01089629.1.p1 GENE.GHVS01089629.1~~GHVS01089629.1.p1  ORF type:complete len:342 (-),score=27.48 GHVS01089629.1:253-1278(-)